MKQADTRQVQTRRSSPAFVILGMAVVAIGYWLVLQNLSYRTALQERFGPPATRNLQAGDHLTEFEVVELGLAGELAVANRPLLRDLDQPTMIFVLTSTCPYCARSLPYVSSLRDSLASMSVPLVGIVLDRRTPPLLAENSALLGYPLLAPATLRDSHDLGVTAVPTIVLVDREGSIERVWTGEVDARTAATILEEARAVISAGN